MDENGTFLRISQFFFTGFVDLAPGVVIREFDYHTPAPGLLSRSQSMTSVNILCVQLDV